MGQEMIVNGNLSFIGVPPQMFGDTSWTAPDVDLGTVYFIEGVKGQALSTGVALSITANCAVTSVAVKFKFALYDASYNLVASSVEKSLTNVAPAYQATTFNLTTNPTLIGGNYYYIMGWCENLVNPEYGLVAKTVAGGLELYKYTTGYNYEALSGVFPNPINPALDLIANKTEQIYCSYLPL